MLFGKKGYETSIGECLSIITPEDLRFLHMLSVNYTGEGFLELSERLEESREDMGIPLMNHLCLIEPKVSDVTDEWESCFPGTNDWEIQQKGKDLLELAESNDFVLDVSEIKTPLMQSAL